MRGNADERAGWSLCDGLEHPQKVTFGDEPVLHVETKDVEPTTCEEFGDERMVKRYPGGAGATAFGPESAKLALLHVVAPL